MLKNGNIIPRALTEEEKIKREAGVFDTFANYLCFCPACGYVDKTNMYLMRAESRVKKVNEEGLKCPCCGKCVWELGYPKDTKTGFMKFKDEEE